MVLLNTVIAVSVQNQTNENIEGFASKVALTALLFVIIR